MFAYFVLHRTRTHRMTCAFAPPPLPDRLAPAAPGPQNGLILLSECAIWQPSTTESNAWPPLRTAPTTLPHFYHRGCSCCLLVVNVYPFHWPVSSVASWYCLTPTAWTKLIQTVPMLGARLYLAVECCYVVAATQLPPP